MRRVLLIGLACALGASAAPAAQAQAKAGSAALECRSCHTAKAPTKKDPALVACPRLLIKGYHSLDEAPQQMTLGRQGGAYGPVSFSHRDHAHMAETGQGCTGCHHYDQARPIQPCKACHSAKRLREDLARPDLQAAMHRQCLECHREWRPASACGTCHQSRAGEGAGRAAERAKPPKPVAPGKLVYQTPAEAGSTVTFRHDQHTQLFGLSCAECHQQESCASCHAGGQGAGTKKPSAAPERLQAPRTQAETHARCAACHGSDKCSRCHTDQPVREVAFDHRARAGWALNRFHARLACQQCHRAPGKFARLSADCESCHKDWQKKFDHGKTGLALDELHLGLDCASCHRDTAFARAPACADCHTDKAYPRDKPGKRVAGNPKP
jgi:hypothetical protein